MSVCPSVCLSEDTDRGIEQQTIKSKRGQTKVNIKYNCKKVTNKLNYCFANVNVCVHCSDLQYTLRPLSGILAQVELVPKSEACKD